MKKFYWLRDLSWLRYGITKKPQSILNALEIPATKFPRYFENCKL